MKHLAIVAALALLPTTAMSNTAAEWDCGNGAKASSNRGEFGIWIGRPYDDKAYPLRGSRHLDWTWDFRGSKDKVWLNGKLCKRTN